MSTITRSPSSAMASQSNIHPSAIVDPLAEIHPTATIGPYCIIDGPVIVGPHTVLHSHVTLKGPLTIGANNTVFSFASIGCDPQDKKYHQEIAFLEIGDFNIIRECATISRGTQHGGGLTRIGSHNLLMAYVHIAHDCKIGDHNTLSNNASLAGHVEIGSYVGLGGFSAVHQFVRIGSYAFTGGASIISKDIPPYTLVAGHPAKLIGLNLEGLKRQNFLDSDRSVLKEYFRLLFLKSSNILETAQSLLLALPPSDRIAQPLLEFILSSPRGLTR